MDLKNFIAKTITDIIAGLDDASNITKKKIGLYSTGKDNQRHIEFDVAVAVQDKNKINGGIEGGIKVLEIIEIGAKGKKAKETNNSSVSRIKFGVRVK